MRFHYYNASAVRVDSVSPLGGPSGGGTVVTVRGAGYVDRGGVFCRFGSDEQAATVEATLSPTSTELLCVSPPRRDWAAPAMPTHAYVQVHATASCCSAGARAEQLGTIDGINASVPASCEASCTSHAACRFFSHSLASRRCELCADCAYRTHGADAQFTSWQRLGPPRSPVRLQLMLNGVLTELLPSRLSDAATFTYYTPQSLVVSTLSPIGGPVAGGTEVTLYGTGFLPLGGLPLCLFGAGVAALEPTPASMAADGASLRCRSPAQPNVAASMVSVRSVTADGRALPQQSSAASLQQTAAGDALWNPQPNTPIAHRWTADGCNSAGASHAQHCTPVATGSAAVTCCALDGRSCQSMCVSPVDGTRYSLDQPGGLANTAVTFDEAERLCHELMMRLCTLDELAEGTCCGGGCAFDDARVWSRDDCTLPSEQTAITALPLMPEMLRVSVNGQQYGGADLTPRRADQPALPAPHSGLAQPAPGFTYYDAAHLALSAVIPTGGPVAGGTLLTILGLGFADLGVSVDFLAADGNATLAAATLAYGEFRGRLLTCYSPPAPVAEAQGMRIELSLNGAPYPPAMTTGSLVQFSYFAEPPDALGTADPGSGDAAGSGDAGSGDAGSGDAGSGQADPGSG